MGRLAGEAPAVDLQNGGQTESLDILSTVLHFSLERTMNNLKKFALWCTTLLVFVLGVSGCDLFDSDGGGGGDHGGDDGGQALMEWRTPGHA